MKRRRADPLYVELSREVARAGFFEKDDWGYIWRFALLVALFVACYVALLVVDNVFIVGALLLLLAQVVTQIAYISHDAGHLAVSKKRGVIWGLGHFGMTFLTGFSFSWWKHSHDNHHEKLNERDGDLAMKYSLVLAVHADNVRGKRGFARWILRWQGHYVWLLMPFYHFAMMFDGLLWIARNPRTTRVDQLLLPLYVVLWFVIPSFFIGWERALIHWAAESMIASVYLVLTFILHHVGKKVILPSEESTMTLLRQQVETTRTLKTWRIFDWYYSGLNYHIEHHLFPWCPHWRYRQMRGVVQAFCRKHAIPYKEQGFWSAVWEVFVHLRDVGRIPDAKADTPAACAPSPNAS